MRSEPEAAQAESRYQWTPYNHSPAAKPIKKETEDRLGQRRGQAQRGREQTGRREGDLKFVNQKGQEWRKKRSIEVDDEMTQS